MTDITDMMTIQMNDEDLIISMDRYREKNRPAMLIYTLLGECECAASVNIPEAELAEDEIIGDDNNSRMYIDAMIKKNYLTETGRYAYSGYCKYRILKMCDQMMKELRELEE